MDCARDGADPGMSFAQHAVSQFVDNSQWPLNSLLVSHEHRVIYTPIAKNANTTLKTLFVRLSGYSNCGEALAGDVHSYLISNPTGLSLCDYSSEEATRILADDSYFRFAMLRDPLTRSVSAYLDKFVINPPPAGEHGEPPIVIGTAIDWVYRRRGERPDYDWSITFNEFIDYVAQNDDLDLDTQFKSQESYLDHQRLDFLGAIEQMDRLTGELEPRFGQHVEMEWKNRTARKKPLQLRLGLGSLMPIQLRAQRFLPHTSELLTKRITDQLKHRYGRDFELWREALETE